MRNERTEWEIHGRRCVVCVQRISPHWQFSVMPFKHNHHQLRKQEHGCVLHASSLTPYTLMLITALPLNCWLDSWQCLRGAPSKGAYKLLLRFTAKINSNCRVISLNWHTHTHKNLTVLQAAKGKWKKENTFWQTSGNRGGEGWSKYTKQCTKSVCLRMIASLIVLCV